MSATGKLGPPKPVDTIVGDGDSLPYNTRSRVGHRIILDGSAAAGGGTFNTQGSGDGVAWYNLGTPIVVAAGETRTRWIGEPNTYLRVQTTGAVGTTEFRIQEFS